METPRGGEHEDPRPAPPDSVAAAGDFSPPRGGIVGQAGGGATSAAPVPPALASPSLYRVDPERRPRLDRREMLRYLGYNGQEIGAELSARIEAVVEELELTIEPRGVRRVFAVDAAGTDAAGMPCIRLAGTQVELCGRDIYRHLKDARFCALFACTLGMDCERRLRTLASQHPLESAVYDAACSAYVEAAVEQMDAQVKANAAALGLAGNWRFSPGYGDCPLTAQPQIIATLNATRLLGLTTTATNLLMPTKSVTAVIGLFDGNVHDADTRPTCKICRQRAHCRFRANGQTCYGEKP